MTNKYTEEYLFNRCREYCEMMPEEVEMICPIKINGRLKTTLGRFKSTSSKPIAIEISKKVLEHCDDDTIENILRHEFAHYYVFYTTHENHGHDEIFKKACSYLECNAAPRSKTNILLDNRPYKYEIVCSSCGKVLGYRRRAGKFIKNPGCYKSNCCHAPIKIIQNY